MVKVLFFGTPDIAVPYLDWLTRHAQVVGVVCRPDEPAGRGYELKSPPTKRLAKQKALPVFQPAGAWTDETVAAFKSLGADIGVIVAYGRILPRSVFTAPKLGCVNIHFSLLPKYRGAAPMQWALINGETKTGVSAFWLEEGLDSGPLFHQAGTSVEPEDDIGSLRDKLIPLGIRILEDVIRDVSAGNIIRRPQSGEPSMAPLLKKEDGKINWVEPAQKIVNLVRGVCEWPGAVTRCSPSGDETKKIKIYRARVKPGCAEGQPGVILNAEKSGISVQAGQGGVLLETVQPEGKKPMAAWDFWQGARLKVGDVFE